MVLGAGKAKSFTQLECESSKDVVTSHKSKTLLIPNLNLVKAYLKALMTIPLCHASHNTSRATNRLLQAPRMKHSTGTSPLPTIQYLNLSFNRRNQASLLIKPGHKLLLMPLTLSWRKSAEHKRSLTLTSFLAQTSAPHRKYIPPPAPPK